MTTTVGFSGGVARFFPIFASMHHRPRQTDLLLLVSTQIVNSVLLSPWF